MPRVFFALQPTAAQRMAMHEAAAPLLRELGTRPVPADDLHLTLCFLGEAEGPQLDALMDQARRIRAPAIDLRLSQLDYWPDSRVLCLLPEAGHAVDTVLALAAQLGQAARAAGFAADPRGFRPHITLGRMIPSREPLAQGWPQPLADSLTLTASGFVLMRSTANPSGPRYDVQRAWPESDQAEPLRSDS